MASGVESINKKLNILNFYRFKFSLKSIKSILWAFNLQQNISKKFPSLFILRLEFLRKDKK